MSVSSNNLGQTARQTWIDIYKGIAIVLVVLGHLEIPQQLYNYIFLFHMYAFFFIAGVTFKVKEDQSFGVYVWDNVKRLYIPYLFFAFAWDITNVVVQLFIEGSFDLSPLAILKNVLGVIIGGGVFSSSASLGPAWFLLALLFVRIVCWLIVKVTHDNDWVFAAFSVALFAVGYACQGLGFLPFKIFSALTVFVFVFAGYELKKIMPLLVTWKPILWVLGAILSFGTVLVVSLLIDRTVVLISNTYPSNPILTLLGGFGGCFGILFVSLLIAKLKKVSQVMAYYGVNSLILMGVHSEINFLCRLIFYYLGIPQVIRVIAIFIITMLVSVPICYVLNNYFPFLVGRKRSKV